MRVTIVKYQGIVEEIDLECKNCNECNFLRLSGNFMLTKS